MKPTNQLIYYDGMKAGSLWGGEEEGWVFYSGNQTNPNDPLTQYYQRVPWMFRGIYLRADGVANIPFAITKNGEDVDTSKDWQNKIGFLPDPQGLLWLIEASLTLAGKAYLWRQFNELITKSLRYVVPQSVTYDIQKKDETSGGKITKKAGEITFKRAVDGTPKDVPAGSIVYLWLRDPTVEIGEAKSYPALAAQNASGVLFNMDEFVTAFFRRGAIKVTIFETEGMSKESAEDLKSWWEKMATGIRNAWTTRIANAKSIKPVVVGEGVKELENNTLTDDKKKDIASAFGIPFAILFSDAANFATAQQDKLNFLDYTIVPECKFIASKLNEQIFAPMGYKFEFRPETLDAYQQDENDRAQALKLYVDAGYPLLMASDILGVELDDDQRAELEAAEKEKKERAAAMQEALNKPPQSQPGQTLPNNQPNPNQNSAVEQTPDANPAKAEFDAMGIYDENDPIKRDLKVWRNKVLKHYSIKHQISLNEFVSGYIPISQSKRILENLKECKNEKDIMRLFFNEAQDVGKPGSGQFDDLIAELRAIRSMSMGATS